MTTSDAPMQVVATPSGGDGPHDGDGLHDLTVTGAARRTWGRALDIIGPIVVIAAVIGAWQAATTSGLIKTFVLPAPSSIARAVLDQPGLYWRHTLRTTEEAMAAFVAGSFTAIVIAVAFVHSRFIERSVYPLTLAAQAIPVVALAPILSIWLGPGMAPKILVAGFLVFFPTLVNMQRGLRAVDPEIAELMRSYNASWWRILVKVRLPASLPFLFVALKIGAGGCFLGALTAEWIGSDRGLGYLVTIFGSQFQIPQLWGAAIIASILAVSAFGLVGLLERLALPWRRGRSSGS
jgi:ABC-type nitrate/sulfonate/bicarbonate transport system permease component